MAELYGKTPKELYDQLNRHVLSMTLFDEAGKQIPGKRPYEWYTFRFQSQHMNVTLSAIQLDALVFVDSLEPCDPWEEFDRSKQDKKSVLNMRAETLECLAQLGIVICRNGLYSLSTLARTALYTAQHHNAGRLEREFAKVKASTPTYQETDALLDDEDS